MDKEKKKFYILIVLLICFTCTAWIFGNENRLSDSESEEKSKVTEESEKTDETRETFAETMISTAETDFFTDYRISREKQRDEISENLRAVAEDVSREEKARSEANASLSRHLAECAAEDSLEKILLGRNYEDVLFIYNSTMPVLIVKKPELSAEEKTELKNFIAAYLGIGADTISVFTVWRE